MVQEKRTLTYIFKVLRLMKKILEHICKGDACCSACHKDAKALLVGTEVNNRHKSISIEIFVGTKDCHPKTIKVYDKVSWI